MKNYYLDNMIFGMHNFGYLHRYGLHGKVSGNLSCIGEMQNVAVLLYGPRGCGFHYRYFARARHSAFFDLECLDMRNRDVIFGGEEKLTEMLKKIDREKKPEIIFILPSVVSDVVNDDIAGIVGSVQSEVNAVLVPVSSQVFSHMNKNNSKKMMREKAAQKKGSKFVPTAVYPGCGYVEVMDALVHQVMEVQDVEKDCVNIEAFVWGYGGAEKIKSMAEMLSRMDIKINSFMPSCDLAGFQRAPKAALNIVRRKKWAVEMEKRFGTPFLHIADMGEWHGIEGITDFYRVIAEKLGGDFPQKAEAVLKQEREKIAERYIELKQEFSHYKCCYISNGLFSMDTLIKNYREHYGLPLHRVIIILKDSYLADTGLDEESFSALKAKAESELKTGEGATGEEEILFNPTTGELQKALDECDFLISNGNPRYERYGLPLIPAKVNRAVFTYGEFLEIMEEISRILASPQKSGDRLLLNRLQYDKIYYPTSVKDDNSCSSREMFNRLWRRRN